MPNWHKICPSKVTTTFLGAGFSNSLNCWAIFQQSCQHNHGTHVKQEMATFWTTQELCFWGVPIYPIIYLGQDIMPLSIVTKCHEDLLKTLDSKSWNIWPPTTGVHIILLIFQRGIIHTSSKTSYFLSFNLFLL